MIVGLTGGIASGKSTICHHLVDFGCYVMDADIVAREVVDVGTPGLEEVIRFFGEAYRQEDGSLNRAMLGQTIFHDEEKRQQLNAIVHPLVRERLWKEARAFSKAHTKAVVVLDIPLLFESGIASLADLTVLIYAPKNVQVERLMMRNQFDREEALARIEAQMSIEAKRALADWVVYNTGAQEDTMRLAHDLAEQLHQLAGQGSLEDGRVLRNLITKRAFQ